MTFTLQEGETLGVVGESGLGQERDLHDGDGPHQPQVGAGERRGALPRDRPADGAGGPAAPDPRRRHRDGLPGPDDLAAPDVPGRRPDRRGREGPPQRQRRRGRPDGRGRPAQGRHPLARAARAPVPARVLRRHAPAGDDRDGAGARPRAPDRRRADDGARRDRAGADPRAHRRDEGAPGDRRGADQPQHGRHRRRGPERDDHVRGPAGGDGHPRRDLPGAAPPLRLGAARVDPAPGRARGAAGADRGLPALAHPPAARLRVPPALPAPLRAAATARIRRWSTRTAPGHRDACLLSLEDKRRLWAERQRRFQDAAA